MNYDAIFRYFTRAAAWQLMRRSPTWLLLLVVALAFLYAGTSHGEDLRVFNGGHGQTFVQGSNGYSANGWSTPSGNQFWSDNNGNTLQVYPSGGQSPNPALINPWTPHQ